MRRLSSLTIAMLLLPVPSVAQGPGSTPPTIVAQPRDLARELEERANADKVCWVRAETRTVDWVAQRDPRYRRDVFGRYILQVIDDGWRWTLDDGTHGRDLHAVSGDRVKGLRITSLEVHAAPGDSSAWAIEQIDGPLSKGSIRFQWTVPPERICMADGLRLHASAEVVDGSPGAEKILFVLPISREQMAAEGPDVKACSPHASTAVDSEVGVLHDEGLCHRTLYHLTESASWSVWLSLPESFWVVYPYEPEKGHRHR